MAGGITSVFIYIQHLTVNFVPSHLLLMHTFIIFLTLGKPIIHLSLVHI